MAYAVVTGAGSGIGRAVARAFAARGLDVALLGRHAADLEETRAMISQVRAECFACDVSSESSVMESSSAILAAFGSPRAVVNNAGVVERKNVVEMTLPEWQRVLDINLTGTFLVSRAFLPAMIASKTGRIVSIASISATLGTPRLSAYCASKWGVLGFSKSLAEELRGTGLQALTVLPGSVDTAMLEGSGFPPEMTPEHVANVVVYASLDAPDAMNGSSVEVFGP